MSTEGPEFSVRVDQRTETPDRSPTAPVFATRAPEGVLLRVAGRSYPLTRDLARALARELTDAAE